MTAPANLTPTELNIVQIVCSMAWSDGSLSGAEKELMLDQISQRFGNSAEESASLRRALQDYVAQNPVSEALEQLVPQLQSENDRELVLKLGYMVIRSSDSVTDSTIDRMPTELSINAKEKVAYRRLVELLNLPEEKIEKLEWAAETDLQQSPDANPISSRLGRFLGR
jgi:uncharacterized tellurite resistance protein B-like protein